MVDQRVAHWVAWKADLTAVYLAAMRAAMKAVPRAGWKADQTVV